MRGLLGFFFQLMLTVGILFTSLLGLGLDWRWISTILAVFPLISVIAMILVPESPYYSLKKGNPQFDGYFADIIFTNASLQVRRMKQRRPRNGSEATNSISGQRWYRWAYD